MNLHSFRRRILGGLAIVGAITAAVAPITGSPQAAAPVPTQQLAIDDLDYLGAFRVTSAALGESSTNYAVGTLGYNPANNSLFLAGHAHHNAIAEFAIPDRLGAGDVVADLPVVDTALQDFAAPLDRAPTGNPDGIDRIDGLHVIDDRLIVNAERWYDASGGATDTTLTLSVGDLAGDVSGYYEMNGAVHAGGYMSPVPAEWQDQLGGPVVTGWASNTSIIGRHSVGPSLFTFDPADLDGRDAVTDPAVDTVIHMNFPYAGRRFLDPDALIAEPGGASPLWNFLAEARYAFIAPGTATFVVVGSIGGVNSGIGYKITQDDGNLCGGYCAYDSDDGTNAYWLFDVNDILAADDVHLPRPYAHGSWSVPFDDDGDHSIIGGAFDPDSSTLYLSLRAAGQVGTYDRPPLIVAYRVPTDGTYRPTLIDATARALAPATRLAD